MAPKPTTEPRTSINFRLTAEGAQFVNKLAAHWGISNTSVAELGIRLLAERMGYHPPDGLMTMEKAEASRKARERASKAPVAPMAGRPRTRKGKS